MLTQPPALLLAAGPPLGCVAALVAAPLRLRGADHDRQVPAARTMCYCLNRVNQYHGERQ